MYVHGYGKAVYGMYQNYFNNYKFTVCTAHSHIYDLMPKLLLGPFIITTTKQRLMRIVFNYSIYIHCI